MAQSPVLFLLLLNEVERFLAETEEEYGHDKRWQKLAAVAADKRDGRRLLHVRDEG